MGQLVSTLIDVAVAIGVTLALFVGANALLDLAPRNPKAYAVLAGAVIGAVVGAVANSGGWFVGGLLWPIGGAVVGAAVGALTWGRRPPPLDRRQRTVERWRPVVFIAPAMLFLVVVLIVPTLRTLYLSFRSRRSDEFVGIDNYDSVFSDNRIFSLDGLGDVFTSRPFVIGAIAVLAGLAWTIGRGTTQRTGVDLSAPTPVVALTGGGALLLLGAMSAFGGIVLWNNLFWIVFVTGVSTVLGLAIAVLADRARGESVAKSMIFMPMAISFVGASVIWRFVYAFTPPSRDQIGLLNAAWVGFGGDPQAWLQQRPWNTLFLIAIMIWIQTGFAMVVLSAAIKAVPTELLEAARVDGATEGQTFWRVTVPQIRTTIAVVVTTLIVTVLKVYDIVKVMTNGEFGTDVIANQMFDEAFINRDFGRGSALAVLLFVAVVPLMVVNVRRARREAA